jgi:hypothetical protein
MCCIWRCLSSLVEVGHDEELRQEVLAGVD